VINSTDYFLYLPLMPQVTSGLVEPRHICVELPRKLPSIRFKLGMVTHVGPEAKAVHWASPEGGSGQCGYDRLILTTGSVSKLLPVPGVAGGGDGCQAYLVHVSRMRGSSLRPHRRRSPIGSTGRA
jgi:NADH:quinone reductase (non-electrogenic)